MNSTMLGKDIKNPDAVSQVTGRFKYTGDLYPADFLAGVVLRSSYAFAKLVQIDTSRAEKIPGVIKILTARDIPGNRFGRYLKDQILLANECARYSGEPVAVILAADKDTAEYARDLIKVEYEPLTPIYDPMRAMDSDDVFIHPDLDQYGASWAAIKEKNVCSKTIIHRGDIDKGFAESDFVFENTFETQMVHQCPLETQAAVAQMDASGRLEINTAVQLAFANQFMLAEALQIPPSKICLNVLPSGGSFGSKIENMAALYAGLLAMHTHKPVRVHFSRKEEFLAITPRHPARIRIKTGVTKDGTLKAWQTRVVFDTGAYAWSGPVVTAVATMFSVGPYRVPHIDLIGRCVYTNKVPCSAFRGYGNPQAAFAHESQMDIIAKSVGIEPMEIRLKNMVEDGDRFPTGQQYQGCTLKETIRAAEKKSGRQIRSNKKLTGSGMACIQHVTGGLPSSIVLKVNLDGTISMMLGIPEIGTGVSTVACRVISEELSLPVELIRMMPINTDSSPFDHGLGISRSCFNVGNAARLAGRELKRQIIQTASNLLRIDPEFIRLQNGRIECLDATSDRSMTWNEFVVSAHYAVGGPLIATGSYLYPVQPADSELCKGMPIAGFPQFTFGTQVAEIEVDPDTGHITVLRITAAHDVGKVINSHMVKGQIEGGILQGIGYALTEEMKFEFGKPVNDNLMDYKLPTSMDVPEIEPVVIEEPDPQGPYGAKGIGEPPIVATAAAIANAFEDATGIRIKKLPLTPERVLEALQEKTASQ